MLKEIRNIVCSYFKISVEDFESDSKRGRLTLARRTYFILANRYVPNSRTKMVEFCGDRKPSTATLAIFQANDTLLDPYYSHLSKDVDAISEIIDKKILKKIGDDIHLRITTYDSNSILVAIASGTVLHVGTYDECITAREKFFKRYVQRTA